VRIRITADGAPVEAAPASGPVSISDAAMDEARLVAREAGGAWVAQILNAVLRFAAAFFAARILGVSGYGTYTLALTVTAIGGMVSMLGLSPGVLPFLSRARRSGDHAHVPALVRVAVLLVSGAAVVVAVAVSVAAGWMGEVAFRQPELVGVLRALSPLVVLSAITGVLTAFLQGFLAVKERAWIEHVLVTGLTAVVLAGSWSFGWGWTGVIAATLVGPAIGLACAAAVLSRISPGALRAPLRGVAPLAGPLLAHSWPLLGTSMLVFVLTWTDILLMGAFRPGDEVGVYGLCARLVVVILFVHESVGQVFLPRLSDLFEAGDRDGMKRLYRLTSRWAMWPALVGAWALVFWGGDLLALFGPDFVVGAAPLAILAAAKAVAAVTGMSGRVFAVTGRARLNLVNLVLMVLGNIVLNVLWIPGHGGLGAAAATFVSFSSVKILQVVEVGLVFRLLPWDRRSLLPIVGVGALAIGVASAGELGTGPGGWMLSLAAFGVASLGMFLLWGVGDEERAVGRALVDRFRGGERS
jgi:O-antigen/teichoic acid export membrane protein